MVTGAPLQFLLLCGWGALSPVTAWLRKKRGENPHNTLTDGSLRQDIGSPKAHRSRAKNQTARRAIPP